MSIVHCVLFDYAGNHANERDIVIRSSFVPTNCVLLTHPKNHETYADFHKFFYKLHSVWKLFKTYSQKTVIMSHIEIGNYICLKGNFRTCHHEKPKGPCD